MRLKFSIYPHFALKLAALSAAVQFAIHAWWQFQSGNPVWIMPRLVSWLHDCVIILGIYIICVMLLKLIKSRPRTSFLLIVPAFLWVAAMSVLLLYPRHVPDFLNFPVNIFTVGAGAAGEFAKQFLSPADIVFASSALVMILVLSCLRLPFVSFNIKPFYKTLFFIFIAATLAAPSPNPLVFSIGGSVVTGLFGISRQFPLLKKPKVPGSSKINASGLKNNAIQGVWPAKSSAVQSFADIKLSRKIAHIIVIVMETVEGRRFVREILENKNTFMGSKKDQFCYFSKYFTTNLDSYTSLIAMMTSVFVPFQSYSDPQMYSGVQRALNLAASLKKSGTACAFVSTAQNQPFIPVKDDWDRIVTRKDIPFDSSMAHIDSPPVESALEDRAALPVIIDFMKKNASSFILQECIFGHSQAWLDLSGMSQLEYYDRYVRELSESMAEAGLRENTLLVIIADHGSRQDPSEFENYLVPMIMWGPGVKAGSDDRFLSHLDFAGLLRELISATPLLFSQEPVLTVGHSGKWVYGEIRPNLDYQFLDNSRGLVMSSKGALEPISLYDTFQRYIDCFMASFPEPARAGRFN